MVTCLGQVAVPANLSYSATLDSRTVLSCGRASRRGKSRGGLVRCRQDRRSPVETAVRRPFVVQRPNSDRQSRHSHARCVASFVTPHCEVRAFGLPRANLRIVTGIRVSSMERGSSPRKAWLSLSAAPDRGKRQVQAAISQDRRRYAQSGPEGVWSKLTSGRVEAEFSTHASLSLCRDDSAKRP